MNLRMGLAPLAMFILVLLEKPGGDVHSVMSGLLIFVIGLGRGPDALSVQGS